MLKTQLQVVFLLLPLVTLSLPLVFGHKHKHNHNHNHNHKCESIEQILEKTKGLERFTAGLKKADIQYLNGLFNDTSEEATFLAVPDVQLGHGDTVMDQAHLRYLQHTLADVKVKTCHVKDGDSFKTTIGTVLRAEVVGGKHHHGHHHKKHGGKGHWGKPFAFLWNHHNHEKHHNGGHHHGKHHHKKHHHGKHHHRHQDLQHVVAEALKRSKKGDNHGHGQLYLINEATSQRIQVYHGIKACEGSVLLVSAFMNAPPSPDNDLLKKLPARTEKATANKSLPKAGLKTEVSHWMQRVANRMTSLLWAVQ